MNRRAFRKFLDKMVKQQDVYIVSNWEVRTIREDINNKKTFSFGHCPNEGGRSTHARNFWPFFKKSIKRVYFFKNANVLNF